MMTRIKEVLGRVYTCVQVQSDHDGLIFLLITSDFVGGVCVCPVSMQEALAFFELDSVLSLTEREVIFPYSRVSLSVVLYN